MPSMGYVTGSGGHEWTFRPARKKEVSDNDTYATSASAKRQFPIYISEGMWHIPQPHPSDNTTIHLIRRL